MSATKTLLLIILATLAALPAAGQGSPPAAPTGLGMFNENFPAKPIYYWDASEGATDYSLAVRNAANEVVFEDSSTAENACTPPPNSSCYVNQIISVDPGTYTWRVRAHNAAGYSAYSETMTFTVSHYSLFNFPAIPSPTPIEVQPTPNIGATVQVPTGPIYAQLSTAEYSLQQAPDDLTAGTLPNANGAAIFRYAKWILSPSIGLELFGPFGLTVGHIAAAIGLVIFLASVYFIIFIAALILRFVVWVISKIAQGVDAIPFLG